MVFPPQISKRLLTDFTRGTHIYTVYTKYIEPKYVMQLPYLQETLNEHSRKMYYRFHFHCSSLSFFFFLLLAVKYFRVFYIR